jgi:hypothetical protein
MLCPRSCIPSYTQDTKSDLFNHKKTWTSHIHGPSPVGLGLTLTPKKRRVRELCGQWGRRWQLRRVFWWPYSFDDVLQRHRCLAGVSPWHHSARPYVHTTSSEAMSSSAPMAANPFVLTSSEPRVHVPSVHTWWDCLSQLVHGGRIYDRKEYIRGGAHLKNSISVDAKKSL